MVLFEFIVMLIRVGPELYFLNRNVLLMLLCFVLLLVELVQILAVIHDSANRWVRSGCNFDKVQTSLLSNFDRSLWRQDSELFVLIVNDTNFSSPDSVVYPDVFIDKLCPPESVLLIQTNGNLNKRRALFSMIRTGSDLLRRSNVNPGVFFIFIDEAMFLAAARLASFPQALRARGCVRRDAGFYNLFHERGGQRFAGLELDCTLAGLVVFKHRLQ
jgi:hypothetical protein